VLLSGQHQGVVQGLQDVAGTGWYLVTPGRSYNAGGHQTGLLRWDSAAALAVGLHTHRVVMVDVVCGGVTAAFGVQGGPCEFAMLLSMQGASGVVGTP
jgi:hypothetical protein